MYFYKEAGYGDIFPLRVPLTEDVRVAVNQSKTDQAQGPQWYDYKGGYALEFASGSDKTIKFNIQFEHGWQEGSIVTPHIHWGGVNLNAGNVVWTFTHSWANINAAFPTETSSQIIVANETTLADKHVMSNFPTISGTGKTFSSMMICSLTRTGSSGSDTYGSSALLFEFDLHISRDKLGKNL